MNSKKSAEKKALGVDIGNVIIDFRVLDPDFELTEENYSSVPSVAGSFGALMMLNKHFDGEVYLISKATPWAQARIKQWFIDNGFFETTGLNPKNIYFTAERGEKTGICESLGITHFVDDRIEVLSSMIDKVPHLFVYKPREEELKELKKLLPHMNVVEEWDEIVKRIIGP